jgi:hypothetical protein
VGLFVGSLFASHGIRKTTGLSEWLPESMKIILSILKVSYLINLNLNSELGLTDSTDDTIFIKRILREYEKSYSTMFNSLRVREANYRTVSNPPANTRTVGDTTLLQVYSDVTRRARQLNHRTGSNPPANTRTVSDTTLLQLYSDATQAYIDKMHQKVSYAEVVNELKHAFALTPEEESLLAQFNDPLTNDTIVIPVLLNEKPYDLNSILRLPVDANDQRTDPFNNYKFYLRDLQPAWNVANALEEAIKKIKAAHATQHSDSQVAEAIPALSEPSETVALASISNDAPRSFSR